MAKENRIRVRDRDLAKVGEADASPGRNRVWHLDRDPNDPRRTPAAQANLSRLNEEDPEQEPAPQNPL